MVFIFITDAVSVSALAPFRKGLPCHARILNGLLEGMEIGDTDKIIFVDVLPNRHASV